MRNKETSSTTMLETPTPQKAQRSAEQGPIPPGAAIRGKVLCRTRRETKTKDGRTRFIITLSILGSQGLFAVERWAEEPTPADLPVVGQEVELPVRISAYLQAGVPKVRLAWADAESSGAF
jgi:hypothetical protein